MAASSLLQRLGVRGDLWNRFLHWAVSICPRALEPILIALYSTIFFVTCAAPRRAALANLAVLRPGLSAAARLALAWRLFHNFAWTHAEGMAALHADSPVGWEIRGVDEFNKILQHQGGVILLIAHMGSYDVAASLFARKFNRPVNMVRSPESLPETQDFFDSLRRRIMGETYAIHYNRPDTILAAKLYSALSSGEIVALQADRVVDEVSPILLPISGDLQWRLPRGPLTLAHLASCPAFPILLRRSGYRRYVVEIFPQISPFASARPDEEIDQAARRQGRRDRAILPFVRAWGAVLYHFIRSHPAQWFVFERVFVPCIPPPDASCPPLGTSPPPDDTGVDTTQDCPTTSPRSRHGRLLHRIFQIPFPPLVPAPPNTELATAARAGTGLETATSSIWVICGIFLLALSTPAPLAPIWAILGLPLFSLAWLHVVGIPLALIAGLSCKLLGQTLSSSRQAVAITHHGTLAIAALAMAGPALFPWVAGWAGIGLAALLIDLAPARRSLG
jgi:phosphatidylinositol dimannoside acyltransferase